MYRPYTGATGGVGKRVVERLLQSGKHVRALARDVAKARTLLVRMTRHWFSAYDRVSIKTVSNSIKHTHDTTFCCSATFTTPRASVFVIRHSSFVTDSHH